MVPASKEYASEVIGDVERERWHRDRTPNRVAVWKLREDSEHKQQCPKTTHHRKRIHCTLLVGSGAPVAGGPERRRHRIASDNKWSI